MLPLIEWITVRLDVSEDEWRRRNKNMEPQGRGSVSPLSHAETKQATRPEQDHSQIEGARSNSWAECRNKKVSALSRRGDMSLDISFYRTCPGCLLAATLLTATGFFLPAIQGQFWALAMDMLTSDVMGYSSGFINTGGQIAGIISPILIGALIQLTHKYVAGILAHVEKNYFPNYAMIAFVDDVEVLRPEKFGATSDSVKE